MPKVNNSEQTNRFILFHVAVFGVVSVLVVSNLTSQVRADDCKKTIGDILALRSTQSKMRAIQEVTQDGKILLTHKISIESFTRRLTETVGKGIWSLLYDKYHYDSRDGKNWKRSTWHDPNWQEATVKSEAALRAGMTEIRCNLTGSIDGQSFQVFKYRYVTEKPYKSDSRTTLYFDPKARRIVRRISESAAGGVPTVITTTYTPDQSVVVPKPE